MLIVPIKILIEAHLKHTGFWTFADEKPRFSACNALAVRVCSLSMCLDLYGTFT
jgi:hypothetical protein